MSNTNAQEIIDSFHSSFQDKKVLPLELEMIWLKKANAKFSCEIEPLVFDELTKTYNKTLDQYVIDTLAEYMKQLYQEREVSRINKIVSIVGKDISIDGMGNNKKYAESELNYVSSKVDEMINNQKPTAFI